MPESPITDPVAVKFCNEVLRPLADLIVTKHVRAKLAVFQSQAQEIFTRIPDDDTPIDDGSGVDGRNPITGADVHFLIGAMYQEVTAYEADQNAIALRISRIAVNFPRA